MPIARFELPDGRIGRFEVPEGTTPEQAVSLISSNLSSLMPKEESAPAPGITALSVPDNQLVKVPAESPAPAQTQPAASQPWWAPFAASAQGEAQIGKELGPKVFGGNLAQDIFAAAKSTPAYAAAATQSLVGGNTPEDLTSQTDWKNDRSAKARQLSKENAKDPSLQDEYILGITRQKVR